MRHRSKIAILPALVLCLTSALTWAESGILVVHVKDVHEHPIAGIQIGVTGDGGSATTGDDGKARIPLAKQTKENDRVRLQILPSGRGKNFVMVSPWEYETRVPPFANESINFAEITVVQRGDREALVSGTLMKALVEQINKASAPKTADKQAPPEDPKTHLAAVAKQYGLAPDDLDQAIRAWGAKTSDPYEAGLAALYERNYPKASAQLADSLQKREEKLIADQNEDQMAVADAAFFLGASLYKEGKYRDAATALRRCLQLRPDDGPVLNDLAMSLTYSRDYAAAEPLQRRAVAVAEKTWGPNDPHVVISVRNLAGLLYSKHEYAAAEPFFRRALELDERISEPDAPHLARDLDLLGLLLQAKGAYAEAGLMFRRALAIREHERGGTPHDLAWTLNNLAEVLRLTGDYAGAEPLYKRALEIDEKALGSDDPSVATDLNNFAQLLRAKGESTTAEQMYRRALEIDEKALGPDDPDVATVLGNIAGVLKAKGDYTKAEPLYRRALEIDEKALDSGDPDLARELNNLAVLLEDKGDYGEAIALFLRALSIDQKTLGQDHPVTQHIGRNFETFMSRVSSGQKPEK
jgi:tetratricopeptide (TPR) repeat protein